MSRPIYRLLWLLSALVFAGLACSVLSNVQNGYDDVQKKVNAASTSVQEGHDLLSTVAGAATEVEKSGFVQTAQAAATQLRQSGVLDTAEAYATRNGPSLLATAQAFATEQGPSLAETLKAVATQEGPSAMQTLQALATNQAAGGQPPEDVPIVPGENHSLNVGPNAITYATPSDLNVVVMFYMRQMVTNGWKKTGQGTVVTDNLAVLYYEKPDRRIVITLTRDPAAPQTWVLINLQPK